MFAVRRANAILQCIVFANVSRCSVRVLRAVCMVVSRIHTHNAEHWSSKRQISELQATSIVSMRIMYEHSLSLHTISIRAAAQQQHTCDASRFVLGENTWNVNLFMATSFPLVLVADVIVVADDEYDSATSVLSLCDSVHFDSYATDYTNSRFTFGTIVPLRSAWLMMFHVCCGAHLVSVRSLSRSQLHSLCVFSSVALRAPSSRITLESPYENSSEYIKITFWMNSFPVSTEYRHRRWAQAAARCIHQNTCTHKCFLWHFRCVSTVQRLLFYASIYFFLPFFLLWTFYGILTNMFNALNKLAKMWMEHAFSIRWKICESSLIERENRRDRHHRRHNLSNGANGAAIAGIAYICASFDLFCIFIVQWFT